MVEQKRSEAASEKGNMTTFQNYILMKVLVIFVPLVTLFITLKAMNVPGGIFVELLGNMIIKNV